MPAFIGNNKSFKFKTSFIKTQSYLNLSLFILTIYLISAETPQIKTLKSPRIKEIKENKKRWFLLWSSRSGNGYLDIPGRTFFFRGSHFSYLDTFSTYCWHHSKELEILYRWWVRWNLKRRIEKVFLRKTNFFLRNNMKNKEKWKLIEY